MLRLTQSHGGKSSLFGVHINCLNIAVPPPEKKTNKQENRWFANRFVGFIFQTGVIVELREASLKICQNSLEQRETMKTQQAGRLEGCDSTAVGSGGHRRRRHGDGRDARPQRVCTNWRT